MIANSVTHYGSFRDSLKAPVHRWFTYPAGFSYRFVEAKIAESSLDASAIVGDPFVGTGTTSLAVKAMGLHSVGVEAHPFVYWVANTKMVSNYDLERLATIIQCVIEDASKSAGVVDIVNLWPELVYKCFSEENLRQLAALKTVVLSIDSNNAEADFLKLAVTATLRDVTTAGAGWPYIAPSKYQARIVERHALVEFEKRCSMMLSDVRYVQALRLPETTHKLIRGDARKFSSYVESEGLDLVVTSPPYLNNYDYADRTRLETYFWGIYQTWADITREVRDQLVMAATTQVRLSELNGVRSCPGIAQVDSKVHSELKELIDKLGEMRKIKAGKKTYDFMVAGYFEDILEVLKETYKALRPGAQFILVLGDSAPYGVHVATDELVGRLGISVGFSDFSIRILRNRGDKWHHNPQRHQVPLRESVLTLTK